MINVFLYFGSRYKTYRLCGQTPVRAFYLAGLEMGLWGKGSGTWY